MPAIITNLRSIQRMGILADRSPQSPDLQFRRYNLIYGFNGSGKSTLSRLFASLEYGAARPELPEEGSFEVVLDDGARYGCPSKPNGLEQRLLVFNMDYIERNLRWKDGQASPVFFIGAEQAEAAATLANIESEVVVLDGERLAAESAQQVADKAFTQFKRDRAKLTAPQLYLGNRKYEAPALAKDYDTWKEDGIVCLSDADLEAAVEVRRRDEPLPSHRLLNIQVANTLAVFRDVAEICGQSMANVALDELERFPDMLLWIKDGHEFHTENMLEECLFCGNAISNERKNLLTSALDSRIDQFIAALTDANGRLQSETNSLAQMLRDLPELGELVAGLRSSFRQSTAIVKEKVGQLQSHLGELQKILSEKQVRPAVPAEMSSIAMPSQVDITVQELAKALEDANAVIVKHNASVSDFAKHREEAEIAIRKHYIADCLPEYMAHAKKLGDAETKLSKIKNELARLSSESNKIRQQIREHGAAVGMINELVASYLGHRELSIHLIDQGYELHRHDKLIKGAPSEGEKTAIAIAYFLSSLEAEGRKLKDLIVVIDDPVSSLDTRALNFACSLVQSRLDGAGQVFVLTHNLQCMNEFKKAWKGRAREEKDKEPTATFLFLDVRIPSGQDKRSTSILKLSRLLREYDSEYHFLFSHVLSFAEANGADDDHDYMMPNVLRRVLDVFLAFKCPGSAGLSGQIKKLWTDYPDLNRDRLAALERLAQVESHSDNLDDLLSFSSMTIEESRQAAIALVEVIGAVDPKHLAGLRRLCRPES